MAQKPSQPRPTPPEDLTEFSDKELMRLLSLLTSWSSWAEQVVAQAEVEEKSTESQLEKVKAKNAANSTEKTVNATKAKMYDDPDFIAAKNGLSLAYEFRKIAQGALVAINNDKWLVKDELTRRIGRSNA